ncbi:MAG TPA: hypothetical protein VGK02_04910 [Candidatus Aquicultor sp.]
MIKKLLVFSFALLIGAIALQPLAFAAPVPDKFYLRAWPEYQTGQVSLLETVVYPQTTPLPIEVKIAMPEGATVNWAGEMLGQVSQDIQAQPTVVHKGTYDEVTFALTKSRTGQVETTWSALQINGNDRALNFIWTQQYPANQTIFEFREPSQASDIKMMPPAATVNTSSDGSKFYETAPINLPVGKTQTYRVTYRRPVKGPSENAQQSQPGSQQQSPQGAQPSGPSTATSILVMLVAGLIVFMIYAQKSNQRRLMSEIDGDTDNTANAADTDGA